VNRLLSQIEESETSATEEKTITHKQATAKQPAAVSVTPVTQDKKRQTGDLSVYKYFCQASGLHNVVIALSMAVASSFSVVYSCTPPQESPKQVAMLISDLPAFWLQEWVQASQHSPNKDVALYLCIYALLSIAALVTLWVFCWQVNPINAASKLYTDYLGWLYWSSYLALAVISIKISCNPRFSKIWPLPILAHLRPQCSDCAES
jgi:hypothetical protein